MGKEWYIPYPIFSLDNQFKINGDDITEIAKSSKKPDWSLAMGRR
jgi:hypothetical protein